MWKRDGVNEWFKKIHLYPSIFVYKNRLQNLYRNYANNKLHNLKNIEKILQKKII